MAGPSYAVPSLPAGSRKTNDLSQQNRRPKKILSINTSHQPPQQHYYRQHYYQRHGHRGDYSPYVTLPTKCGPHHQAVNVAVPAQSGSHGPQPTLDGFLIAALHNEEDHQLVMALQTDIEEFLADTAMTRLDFPPMNSYQRLLIHRVAQYFGLDHVVLSGTGSIDDTTSARPIRSSTWNGSQSSASGLLPLPPVASPTRTTAMSMSANTGSRPISLFKSDRALHPGIRLELLIPDSEFTEGPCMVNRRSSIQDSPRTEDDFLSSPRFSSINHQPQSFPMSPTLMNLSDTCLPHLSPATHLISSPPPPVVFEQMMMAPDNNHAMFVPMSPTGSPSPHGPPPPPGFQPHMQLTHYHPQACPIPVLFAWNTNIGQWVPVGPVPPHHLLQHPHVHMFSGPFGLMSPMSPTMPLLPPSFMMSPRFPPSLSSSESNCPTDMAGNESLQHQPAGATSPHTPPASPDLCPETMPDSSAQQTSTSCLVKGESYPSPPVTPNVKHVSRGDQVSNTEHVQTELAVPEVTVPKETSAQASHTHKWVRKFFPAPRYQGADTHVANSPPRPIHILHIIPPEGFPPTDLPHLLNLASSRLPNCTPVTFKFRVRRADTTSEIRTQYLLRLSDPVAALGALSASASWTDMHVVQWQAKVAPAREGLLPLTPKGQRKALNATRAAGGSVPEGAEKALPCPKE